MAVSRPLSSPIASSYGKQALSAVSGNSNNSWNPWQMAAAGVGGGALLANLFKDRPDFQNPANAARPFFEKVPGAMQPYFQPYIDQGQRAGGALESEYGQMTSNPAAFLSKIGQGYQQSPGFQFKLNQALQAANNAAASGGMLGSPEHQMENEQVGEGLANQDYEDWLNHVLGIYTGGQAGQESMYKTGAGASTDFGTSLANSLMNQGLLEERSAEAQNKYNQAQSNDESAGFGDIAGLALKLGQFL